MQISSWNTSPSSWRVKLAGPTVCSAANTASFVAGGDCPWADLHSWYPSGEQQAVTPELSSREVPCRMLQVQGSEKSQVFYTSDSGGALRGGRRWWNELSPETWIAEECETSQFSPILLLKVNTRDGSGRQFSDRNPRFFIPRSWDGDKKLGTQQRVTRKFCWLS